MTRHILLKLLFAMPAHWGLPIGDCSLFILHSIHRMMTLFERGSVPSDMELPQIWK